MNKVKSKLQANLPCFSCQHISHVTIEHVAWKHTILTEKFYNSSSFLFAGKPTFAIRWWFFSCWWLMGSISREHESLQDVFFERPFDCSFLHPNSIHFFPFPHSRLDQIVVFVFPCPGNWSLISTWSNRLKRCSTCTITGCLFFDISPISTFLSPPPPPCNYVECWTAADVAVIVDVFKRRVENNEHVLESA